MTAPKFLNFFFLFFSIASFTTAQSNMTQMIVAAEQTTKEMATAESLLVSEYNNVNKIGTFNAKIWPNPSNLGKVRLSVENLPDDPLFIQIFNHKEELVQEGVIQGDLGTNLEHILKLPDVPGNYSIKLSSTDKLLKDLPLKIL